MHTLFLLVLVIFFSIASPAHAKIQETLEMKKYIESVKPGTILVFDLDNTLIEPTQQLGSDQWYYFLEDRYRTQGLKESEAYSKAMDTWNRTQSLIEVKTVESGIAPLIKSAQDRGIQTIGLTARNLDIANVSFDQLKSVGIELGRKTISSETFELSSNETAKFRDGILFVGERNEKGTLLKMLLEKTGTRPKAILYFDDKLKHVKTVDATLTAMKIPSTSFRYGAADAKVESFRKDMANSKLFFDGVLN